MANPKDLRGVGVCQLLKPETLAAFGFTDLGKEGFNSGDPACDWDDTKKHNTMHIEVDTARQGLNETYVRKDSYSVFKELPSIDGYPAVYADVTDAKYRCWIDVGIADTQRLSVQYSANGNHTDDPCAKAREVASAVIAGLPPLSK